MSDAQPFAVLVLLAAAAGLAAVLSNRLTAKLKVPAPGLLLIVSAVAVKIVPALRAPSEVPVERIVTVALLCILFDGGMHIGWSRLRSAWAPITVTGIAGTFLTAAAGAVFLHAVFGLAWYPALLVATAVAPTDPAVVFSVLGGKEVSGRSGTILEGESGANDPVGIALMASLVTAGTLSGGAFAQVGVEFLLQMGVGAAIGILGGRALLWFMRKVPLPSEGLYPLRTLASALVLFGITTIAHGSGFLAVFLAGIVIGDQRAPYQREIQRFHSVLASLGEIVAFLVLGLTVDVQVLARADVWIPGLIFGAVLALVIRPVLVGLCLIPVRLGRNERTFVMFPGLKGAVPILLGTFILTAGVDGAERFYGITVVVVVFSVIVQGGLVPALISRLRLPMRTVDPEPWALGVRLQQEPEGVHRFTIADGAPADGRAVGDISAATDLWITLLTRDQQLLPITGKTTLLAGDQVLILADEQTAPALRTVFGSPDPSEPGIPPRPAAGNSGTDEPTGK